jgi:hypothetical protein
MVDSEEEVLSCFREWQPQPAPSDRIQRFRANVAQHYPSAIYPSTDPINPTRLYRDWCWYQTSEQIIRADEANPKKLFTDLDHFGTWKSVTGVSRRTACRVIIEFSTHFDPLLP